MQEPSLPLGLPEQLTASDVVTIFGPRAKIIAGTATIPALSIARQATYYAGASITNFLAAMAAQYTGDARGFVTEVERYRTFGMAAGNLALPSVQVRGVSRLYYPFKDSALLLAPLVKDTNLTPYELFDSLITGERRLEYGADLKRRLNLPGNRGTSAITAVLQARHIPYVLMPHRTKTGGVTCYILSPGR